MHTIRLNGPWRYDPSRTFPGASAHERSINQPSDSDFRPVSLPRVKLPVDWQDFLRDRKSDSSFAGTIYLLRTFHSPTNLQTGQMVLLRFEELHPETALYLNGELLLFAERGAGVASREDISTRLLESNRLEVCWQVPDDAVQGPFTGAALEIA